MYKPFFSMMVVLFAVSGCQTVDGLKKDFSSAVEGLGSKPASAPTPVPAVSTQKVTRHGRETDPIKRQINAHVDPVSKRTKAELSYAYDLYKPKFSARMRQLGDRYDLPARRYDVLLTIDNDGSISDCVVRDGGPSASTAMRQDMCYAWSFVFFGKKIPSLPPYMLSISTPIPKERAAASQIRVVGADTDGAASARSAPVAKTGKVSQPVPVSAPPASAEPPRPSVGDRNLSQFVLGPPVH